MLFRMAESNTTAKPRDLVVACLAAVAGLFILDLVLFRFNVYPSVLQPDSSTGLFELTFRIERLAQRRSRHVNWAYLSIPGANKSALYEPLLSKRFRLGWRLNSDAPALFR